MIVLVTGGAGYIGSHTTSYLFKHGFQVVVYDDLSQGHAEAVKGLPLIVGDISDGEKVSETIRMNHVDAVIHFAGESRAGESVENPAKYYERNVVKSIIFFNRLIKEKVKYLVFSSSAAVYGEPVSLPVEEDHDLHPVSPYGDTKWLLEKVLHRYHESYGLKYIVLRYFNAAGADPGGEIGEDHRPETHLIPLILQAALKQREPVTIHGDDYPTPDKTAIRDYVHVNDLAEAHVLALGALSEGRKQAVYNLGCEQGFSVREVLAAAARIAGQEIPFRIGPRRPGDPAVLVASAKKIIRELGWNPRYPELDQIIRSAWNWHQSHPKGFLTPGMGNV